MADSENNYTNTSVRQLPRRPSPLDHMRPSGYVVNPHTGALYPAGSDAAKTNGAE
jgi:hypothetical protein